MKIDQKILKLKKDRETYKYFCTILNYFKIKNIEPRSKNKNVRIGYYFWFMDSDIKNEKQLYYNGCL